MSYKVALDVYNGPLDLLLFLIKREEIDIYDIPIARITQQYITYVELLKAIDPEVVSEFLVLAATLMEIKSRTLLPRPPVEEAEDDLSDPRMELVRQLLEYKRFKDAARMLEGSAAERSRKHARMPAEPPVPEDIPLDNVDIWDLFEAFNRLLAQTGKTGAVHQVGVDDTPIALHAADVLDFLQRGEGSQSFADIFLGRNRAEMIGLFLALLELIRQRRVRAAQERPFGPIKLILLDATPLDRVVEESIPADTADEGDASESQAAIGLTEAFPQWEEGEDEELSAEESKALGVNVELDERVWKDPGQPVGEPRGAERSVSSEESLGGGHES